MVKFIPRPHGLAILVQIYNHVSGNCRPRDNRCVRDARKDDKVPVRKQNEIVMRAGDGDIASVTATCPCGHRRCQRGIQIRRRHLPNQLPT